MEIIIQPYKNNIQRVRALQNIILTFKEKFPEESNTNIHLSELSKEVGSAMEKCHKYDNNRIRQFKLLLYKYWKMQYNYYNTTPTIYIYPYRFNLENNYLFSLVSPINNNCMFSKSGIFEDSFNIFDTYTKGTLIFTECTKEEMLDNAKKMCEKALEYRLSKVGLINKK